MSSPVMSYPTLTKRTVFVDTAGNQFEKVKPKDAKAEGSNAKQYVVDGALIWAKPIANGAVTQAALLKQPAAAGQQSL